MDRKTILWAVIIVVALLLYFPAMRFLGLSEAPAPASQTPIDSVEVTFPTDSAVAPVEIVRMAPANFDSSLVGVTDTLPVDSVRVVTNKLDVVLSSAGGGPVSIELVEHSYRDRGHIQMLPECQSATPDVVFAGGAFSSSQVRYQANRKPGRYDATRDTTELSFTYSRPDGAKLIKSYTFYPNQFHYDLEIELVERDKFGFERSYQMVWNTPLGATEPQLETDYDAMVAVAMQADNREQLDDFNNGELNQTLTGSTQWAAVRSRYFAAFLVPLNREAAAVNARGFEQKVQIDNKSIRVRSVTVGLDMEIAGREAVRDSFRIFVGPLDYETLADYDRGMEDILGIGTFPVLGLLIKPFALAIIWLLPRMYDLVPNYGLVIILFALLVKLITLPLSMKSFKSMNAMRELQPKVEELRKKHAKNPQALNSEMMKMYKKHGVNPISGCLPILPQMPLFFALFSVFRSTILLRDAPFVWFVTDLSRGASGFTDPYIVLVVLMIAAQFVSQAITMPSTQQNKALMYVMPLFMGFLFYSFASGLVLYWTSFSIFSLIDWLAFKRRSQLNPEVKAV